MPVKTGKQLKDALHKRGLTPEAFGEATGYSAANIRQLMLRAKLPKHAARLVELALKEIDDERTRSS